MIVHLGRALSSLLFISLIFSCAAQGDDIEDKPEYQPFPYILNYTGYYTEVQLTDVVLSTVAFASEYVDLYEGPRGRVSYISLGTKKTIIYRRDTNEIFEATSNDCQVWDTDESIYDYEAIFEGWLNKEPLVIGPSASIWMADANRDKITYQGETIIRDIDCEAWVYNYTTERNQLTFTYHFAALNWTTPYKVEGIPFRIPVRVEVNGISTEDTNSTDDWYQINQLTDFAFFRPDVPDFRIFEPPEGVGCRLKKKSEDMPPMPQIFRYSAEVHDLLQPDKGIENQEIWYDSKGKLARLDKFTKLRTISELYDFNTGVTYSIVDRRTCSIGPLRYSFFEAYGNEMIGHLKDPQEVLDLDDSYYTLGKKWWRGIRVDVFESVKDDVVFMKKTLSKLVITVYYTKDYLEVTDQSGETQTRIPVFYKVRGYDDKTNVIIDLQYNIFGFDDVIYPDMYTSFRLGRCFPSLNEKSYFILVMSTTPEIASKMEGQDDFVIETLRKRIEETSKISNLRLPLLRADYKTMGVYVTGLMLDRPPAIKQFWLESEGYPTTTDPKLKIAPAADTNEKCAFACVEEGTGCYGFYWCNKACFLKFKDILSPDEGGKTYDFGESCQEWLRAEKNSKNEEAYLADALKNLESAVLDLQINVSIKMDDRSRTIVQVSDIVIGDGPYTGIAGKDKPYDVVINFAKLDPGDETTEKLPYIETLNDCYLACKNSEDLSCSSFSYCPRSSNKQCSISSVLVVSKKNNIDDTVDDRDCYVYSMKYLDYYIPYPGRLAMIPGADTFAKIKTVEECAKLCRTAKDITCRGFEYCQSLKSCVLHEKHILDFEPGQSITLKKPTCIHFAAKYAADYDDTGLVLVDDFIDERSEISLEDCARSCSEEFKDKCLSFNYCPASGPYMTDSSCALSGVTLKTKTTPTTTSPPCHHYEKRNKVDDWAKAKKKEMVTTGYTSSQFTWLVVGMLILGFALGAIGFVGYSYFRAKGSSDTGMTVRFMKQGNL